MPSELHLHLHATRSAELRAEAAAHRLARSSSPRTAAQHLVRTQLGWALVELGLRLIRTAAPGPHDHRFRTVAAR
ncbi:hypothetical protein ACQPZG_21940 [Streptomyces sp. CA-294286]|uniref:hypothetical protein n=1 Tax=Streptomyces sp. CA-294286 TaxID=3240070 RepID=UPI003D8D8866